MRIDVSVIDDDDSSLPSLTLPALTLLQEQPHCDRDHSVTGFISLHDIIHTYKIGLSMPFTDVRQRRYADHTHTFPRVLANFDFEMTHGNR